MKEIIIPGIVRSGTSYLARCLADAGVSLPFSVMDDHREDAFVYHLNRHEESINQRNMTDPHSWRPSMWFLKDLSEHRRNLQRRGADYFIKEPGIQNFCEPYLQVWNDALWVVCVRNPLGSTWSHFKAGQWRDMPTDTERLFHYALQLSMLAQAISNAGVRAHWLNYDGDAAVEEAALREFLGVPVQWARDMKRSAGYRQ